jgi:hypothetical protein
MAPPLLSSIPQPPFGSSPLARPSGNPGQSANGTSLVQEAVDLLEKALPDLPVGHPIHKSVTSAIAQLSKHAPPQGASPGLGLQSLKQALMEKMKSSPMAALLAARGQPGPDGGGGMGMPSPGGVPAVGAQMGGAPPMMPGGGGM